MRVVLDTNVLISALLFTGSTHRFVSLWTGRRLTPLATPAIIKEYARVLGYPKFRLTSREAEEIMKEDVLPFFEAVPPSGTPLPHSPRDPSDAEFLRTAISGKADALVSGDKDLLSFSGRYSFLIECPTVFLRRMELA